MKFLKDKNVYFKSFVVSLMLTIVIFLVSIPFFFIKLMDIPFGILLGGLFQALFFFLFSVAENKKIKLMVTFQIMRTTLLLVIVTLVSLLYFMNNFKVFNPIAFIGIYFVILVISLIIIGKEKKDA